LKRYKSIFVLKVNKSQSIHIEVKIIGWISLKFVFKFSGIFVLTHVKKIKKGDGVYKELKISNSIKKINVRENLDG